MSTGHTLMFRTEFFNAFNTPQFNNPGNTLGTGAFGVISGTRGLNPNRQMQASVAQPCSVSASVVTLCWQICRAWRPELWPRGMPGSGQADPVARPWSRGRRGSAWRMNRGMAKAECLRQSSRT